MHTYTQGGRRRVHIHATHTPSCLHAYNSPRRANYTLAQTQLKTTAPLKRAWIKRLSKAKYLGYRCVSVGRHKPRRRGPVHTVKARRLADTPQLTWHLLWFPQPVNHRAMGNFTSYSSMTYSAQRKVQPLMTSRETHCKELRTRDSPLTYTHAPSYM